MKSISRKVVRLSMSFALALALMLSSGNTFAFASDGASVNRIGNKSFETIYVDIDLAEMLEASKYDEPGSRGVAVASGSKIVNIDGGKIQCKVNYSITYLTEPYSKIIISYSASYDSVVSIDTNTYDGVRNIKLFEPTRLSDTTLRFTIELDACLASGQTNAGVWVKRSGSADVSI